MTNWTIVGVCYLIGIVALTLGVASHYVGFSLITKSGADLTHSLVLQVSWQAFVIGAMSVALGTLVLISGRDQRSKKPFAFPS